MNYDLSQLGGETPHVNTSPYIGYGSNQLLKITQIELKYSKNTGSPKAILHVETPPLTLEGFTPIEGAKGKVGKVACGVYMKDDYAKKQLLRRLLTIGIAMEIDEEINNIKSDSFETAVDRIEKIFVKNGKFAKFTVFAEEYSKPGGKIGVTLFLPRTNFVEASDVTASTIVQFDKNNPYHYKKLPALEQPEAFNDYGRGPSVESDGDVSDLPF